MSAARALPVTPAERACATVLRTWLEWHETPPEPRGDAYEAMLNLGDWLADSGIVEGESLALTPAGRDLLARVEAAERTLAAPPGICQGQMRAYRCALPVGHTGLHADEGRFTLWPDAADTRPVVDAADAKGLT